MANSSLTQAIYNMADTILEHHGMGRGLTKKDARKVYKSVVDCLTDSDKSLVEKHLVDASREENGETFVHDRKITKPGTMTGVRDMLKLNELLGVAAGTAFMINHRTAGDLTEEVVSDNVCHIICSSISRISGGGSDTYGCDGHIELNDASLQILRDIVNAYSANAPQPQPAAALNTRPDFQPFQFISPIDSQGDMLRKVFAMVSIFADANRDEITRLCNLGSYICGMVSNNHYVFAVTRLLITDTIDRDSLRAFVAHNEERNPEIEMLVRRALNAPGDEVRGVGREYLDDAIAYLEDITTNSECLPAYLDYMEEQRPGSTARLHKPAHTISSTPTNPTTSTPTTPEENAMTNTNPTTSAPIQVPAETTKLVDAVLGAATDGAINSVNSLLAENHDTKLQVEKLEAMLADANKRLLTSSQAIPKSGKVKANAKELTYELHFNRLDEVIPADNVEGGWSAQNKKEAGGFEVPTFVWSDSDGNTVEHPDCITPDPTYKFRAKDLRVMARAMADNAKPLLYGDTGVGKTEFVLNFNAYQGKPVLRINFDGEMGRLEIVGREKLHARQGVTVSEFVDGILPVAIAGPYTLLCDEVGFIRQEVSFVMQRVLDGRGLAIAEDGNRQIEPHELFRVVCTDNTNLQLDERGMYQGTKPQNEAFRNRLRPFMYFDYMTVDTEKQVLMNKVPGLDEAVANSLCVFANEARQAYRNGDTQMPISMRNLTYVARETVACTDALGVGPALEEAMQHGILLSASTDDRESLERIWATTKPTFPKS